MELARLRAELANSRMEVDILKNRLRGVSAAHMDRNKQCLHLHGTRTEAACFLEAFVKKPGPGEAGDPAVVAPCVTPFRKLI